MQTFFLGIGLLCVYLFWIFVWRPVIHSWHRNVLFDLRDDLREWAYGKDLLDNQAYKETREIINWHIAHLGDHTFADKVAFIYIEQKYPGIIEKIQNEIAQKTSINEEEAQLFIDKKRTAANLVVARYFILSSFIRTAITAALALILAPTFIIKTILIYIASASKDVAKESQGFAAQLTVVAIFLFSFFSPQYSSASSSSDVAINEVAAYGRHSLRSH